MRRLQLLLLSCVSLFIPFPSVAPAAEPPPNILLIVADDLGWKDVGWHGGRFKTPVMDRLVAEGVELDRHYVQPVCTPTRTALLSGRWTSRFGPHALSPSNLRIFPRGTMTLASALKEQGYETSISGKWHLGSRAEWGPNHYGFDHSYGSMSGAVDPWTHKYRKGPYEDTWHRDLEIFHEEGNATELVSKEAVNRIKTSKAPWFVYVPFQAVHIPIDAPDEYKKLYEGVKFEDNPAKDESQHRFAAFVSQLDAKIGDFVKALDETGQRKKTLIVFTSDNGGLHAGGNAYVSEVSPTPALSSNLPLRGQKNTLYEGGVRVCAFANWPGKMTPRKVSAPMHVADWTPTLLNLVGRKSSPEDKFDGKDIWPVVTGEMARPAPRTIYIPHQSGAIVLRDGWKLIAYKQKPAELYYVIADPHEEQDVAGDNPEKVEEMQKLLTELQADDLKKKPADLAGMPD